jgi:hypothetical protein
MMKSKSSALMISLSICMTRGLVTTNFSYSVSSFIILFMEGVIGYSILAAMITQATTSSGSYSLLRVLYVIDRILSITFIPK